MTVLEGTVVLVTGAANGIGRECALLAAREGAKVVVNDLGGKVDGSDTPGPDGQPQGDRRAADVVVEEIRAAGGQAVANYDSVSSLAGAQHMVQQALDSFGGLHAVVNPAGILRDTMLHKMSEADWDAVIDVHLKGAFNVARASVNHFRDQQFGRYVFFTSTSGLIGNLGQANYAAAKMGVIGLMRILAMEGAAKNVLANAIAPFAWTRMIATIPVKDEASAARVQRMKDHMRADQVAPMAVALAAPALDSSSQIYAVRGNEVFLFNHQRPVRGMTQLPGWNAADLLSHALPAMKSDMVDLGASASVFHWAPV